MVKRFCFMPLALAIGVLARVGDADPFLGLAISAIANRLSAIANQPIFEDRFDTYPNGQPVPAPWEVREGQASVVGGRLRITSGQQNPRVVLTQTFRGDRSFSARFRGAPDNHWCGFAVRGYSLTVNHEFWTFSLVKHAPEGSATLAERPGYSRYVFRPQEMVLRLDLIGHTLRGYLDDKLLLEATDETLPEEGEFMLVSGWGTDVLVDDVKVQPVAEGRGGKGKEGREEATGQLGNWATGQLGNQPQPPEPNFLISQFPSATLGTLKAHPDRPDGIYGDGETVTVTVEWPNGPMEPTPLHFVVLDYYEQPVQEFDATWAGQPLTFTVQPPRRGIFKLALGTLGTLGTSDPDVLDLTSFAVLNPALGERPASEESPFGIHPHWEAPEFHYALARKLGARWARDHDTIQYTWWMYVETRPDEWRWFDDGLQLLAAHRLYLLGEFLNTPVWAANAPPGVEPGESLSAFGAYAPKDWNDLADYVFHTVAHYRGRIKVWEVWNEPHVSIFWKGTPEEYVHLLEVAYTAAKRADPDCVILGGGGLSLNCFDWNERAFRAGLLKWCDKVSIHGYVDAIHPMDAQEMEGWLTRFRAQMREHGGEKPIWSTENSITSISFLNTLQGDLNDPGMPYHFRSAAHNMVRLYVTCLSLGIEKAFYYYANRPKQVQWVLDDPANGCLIEPHGSIKPMGVAYATTADLLDGAAFVERIDLAPTVRVYTFQRGDERIAVYWGLFGRHNVRLELEIAPGDASDRLEVVDILDNVHPLKSDEWRVTSDEVSDTRHATRDTGVSPYGLPLSQEPVFVRARGMEREDFAALWRNAKVRGELPPVEDGTPVPDYKRPIPPQPPFEAAAGVPDGRWLFVDLRPQANMGFADERMGDGAGGWSDEGPLNDLRDMPLGRQRFLGVPFEILNPAENGGKACVVLRSPHTPTLPEAARLVVRDGVAIERLYFLHAAAWSSGQQPIGRYVLHFASGQMEEIALVNGLNNADWWNRPLEGEQSRVVAIPMKVTLNGDPERYLRVLEWVNPNPADRLESIDFVPSQAGPIPILVAVTGIVQ